MRPRVLLIGKDARTDAIAAACAASPQEAELYALAELRIPGLVAKCREVVVGSLIDESVLDSVVHKVRPDLVIIGPEEPLAAGFVDVLTELGIPAFGPSRELAQIESSKAWARQLLDAYGIPGNPDYRVFTSSDDIRAYMEQLGQFVVKPDGLTGGKGVRVFGEHLHSIDEAVEYARAILREHGLVQVEERLDGEEFSLQTITDGKTFIHCPAVQDHKRAFDGDQGPNTGGMGSYSCADFMLPFLTDDDLRDARQINERVIEALAQKTGAPYRGVLYGGFIATREGVCLIEYNCRFGDPEAMNILPLLEGDFVEICAAAAAGTLSQVSYSFKAKATVCKYVVPTAYPAPSPEGTVLELPDFASLSGDIGWFWAACDERDGSAYLTSSRSGAVVGIGDTLDEAESAAETAARAVRGPVRHRSDIGKSEMIARRVDHMAAIRPGFATAGAR